MDSTPWNVPPEGPPEIAPLAPHILPYLMPAETPKEGSLVPDFIEPMVGYRKWQHRWRDDMLMPPFARHHAAWVPDVNRAACQVVLEEAERRGIAGDPSRLYRFLKLLQEHAVGDFSHPETPGHDCECGLYAYGDADKLQDVRFPEIPGAIQMWGRMELHVTGARAQYARILALAVPEKCKPHKLPVLKRTARKYRVPLLPLVELPAYASEFGNRLPESA